MAQLIHDLFRRAMGIQHALSFAAPADQGGGPPGYTRARTGDVHDFDYFAGAWTTLQRRLKTRGAGSDE